MKCIWEQFNTSDIELSPETLPIVAEDASYKLWEVINNLKTFTRHSGGKLTTSIVTELLKDCNVPATIGAHGTTNEWEPLDCEGTFYFQNEDSIVLHDEFMKDVTMTQNGPWTLEANWVSNQRNLKDLTKLWQSIILAIVLGDDAAFQYTIHTTLINPFIGCILPHLVQKTIEYLAFGYTDDTLDRLLRFLKVLVQNYHSRDVANNEEYFNLCNLFVCLLFGGVDMKAKLAVIRDTREKLKKLEVHRKREEVKVMENAPGSLIDSIKKEFMPIRDARDIESEYTSEAYSFVVNPVAISIKTETPDDQRFFDCDPNINPYSADFQDEPMYDATKGGDIKTEATDHLSEEYPSTIKGEQIQKYYDEIFSPFVTDACSDRFVDEVCKLIGYLAGKWGYFEHETTYLLAKRLEIFFFDERDRWTTNEFKWLARITQALAALGETAFRELTIYFEHIPYEQLPEWVIPHFSYGGIYIRGRKDYYFYEYMQEVCGDALLPFLLYYPKYLEKVRNRIVAQSMRMQRQTGTPIKIFSKLKIRFLDRPFERRATTKPPAINDFFPERTTPVRKLVPTMRRIGFKFAGCCPILAKSNTKQNAEPQFVQSIDLYKKINRRIVVGRGKNLKPIYKNADPNLSHLIHYRQYNI